MAIHYPMVEGRGGDKILIILFMGGQAPMGGGGFVKGGGGEPLGHHG